MNTKISFVALVLAAGASQRMGQDKLFAPLLGRPLLSWSLEVLQRSPLIKEIVLVLNPANWKPGQKLVAEFGFTKVVQFCLGGERRQDSARRGLEAAPAHPWVLTYDGARPCLSSDIIERGAEAVVSSGAALAAVPVKDTVKEVKAGWVEATPPREGLWLAQTPQLFHSDLLKQAYAAIGDAEVTDDASAVERLGHKVAVFMGAYENIKVTTPEDLVLAESFLKRRVYAGGVRL